MDIKQTENQIFVVLSERNVRQLLQAFERGYATGLQRRCENGLSLHVRVESDADHYTSREAGPGLSRILHDE